MQDFLTLSRIKRNKLSNQASSVCLIFSASLLCLQHSPKVSKNPAISSPTNVQIGSSSRTFFTLQDYLRLLPAFLQISVGHLQGSAKPNILSPQLIFFFFPDITSSLYQGLVKRHIHCPHLWVCNDEHAAF